MTSAPVCQICGEAILDGQFTMACPACETPHHQDCWDFAGGCSTFACAGGHRATAVAAASRARPARSFRPPRPLPASRASLWLEDLDGRQLDTATRFTRLDLDSPLESILQYGGLAALAGALATRSLALLWVATVVLLLRLAVDCTYLLDNERRQVLERMALGPLVAVHVAFDFDDVTWIGVGGRRLQVADNVAWSYAVMLCTAAGHRLRVTDWTSSWVRASGVARRLAHHMGREYRRSAPAAPGFALVGPLPPSTPMKPRLDEIPTIPPWRTVPLRWYLALAVCVAAHLVLNLAPGLVP